MASGLASAPASTVLTSCAERTLVHGNAFVRAKPDPPQSIFAAVALLLPRSIAPAPSSASGFTSIRAGPPTVRNIIAGEIWTPSSKMAPKSDRGRLRHLQIPHIAAMREGEAGGSSPSKSKSGDYTGSMQQAMGTSLTYRHDLGMNYNHVLPDLIVGSCLQTPADVDRLKTAGVGTIFCLQQDPDLAYFSVDVGAIRERAGELDGIEHVRAPIRDFDPYDLRLRLPEVVGTLYKATKRNAGTATYVHCTAGLGRAPAVALTYMYWIRGYELAAANSLLQSVRPCHPKLDSIKGATADILAGNPTKTVVLSWTGVADERVEIAGLDVGWYERIPLQKLEDGHWCVERDIPVGSYEFKFVVDGDWKLSQDYPWSTPRKGQQQVNNEISVPGDAADAPIWEFRKQIMAGDFVLTQNHRSVIKERLEVLGEG